MPVQTADITPSKKYFLDTTTDNGAWTNKRTFTDALSTKTFVSTGFMIENRSAAEILYSLDGTNTHGQLAPLSGKWFDNMEAGAIWFQSTGGGHEVWITAWSE